MIKVTYRGFQRVANGLRKAAKKGDQIIGDATGKTARAIQRELLQEPYPPKRPNQKYVRTGKLGRGYTARRQGVLTHKISNDTPYAQYVIGRNQAWMHKGRWYTLENKAAEIAKRLEKDMGRVAVDALEREIDG